MSLIERIPVRGALALILAAFPAVLRAQAGDPPVLTAGSQSLTRSQFDAIFNGLSEQAKRNGKRAIAEQLGELMNLAEEARTRKLDQRPDFRQQLALQTNSLLASALYRELSATLKPGEDAVKSYYAEHKSEYESATARHILIRFQGSRVPVRPGQKDLPDAEALAKAKEIAMKLQGGLDFAQLAREESDDSGSGANGGDLGKFGRGQMVKPFEDAAFSLPVGKVSDPVKSPFGYHIIQVQDRTSKSLEDARAEIEQTLRTDLARRTMDELKKKPALKLDEEYFGK